MKYYSLNKKAQDTNFKEAVVRGLAPDKGLYFPESITPLPKSFFDTIEEKSNADIAFEAIKQFIVPEIPEDILKTIVEETLNFDFPVVKLNEQISTLELFHGPTMAFKDVGARFMARCLGYFNKSNTNEVTVLVATSGDTGGAVANGFLGVKGVKVVILYPSGKVSEIQEKQLTTLGQNITALEVKGVFDDCQDMVKKAFIDKELTRKMQLTSANSINIARWLPQLFYYLIAYKQLKSKYNSVAFSVPSGNFGNICAGMVAQKLGLPVKHFIASNNANDTVVNYMETMTYDPKPSVQTISNAMDVGNPSNFIRIQELHDNDFNALKSNLTSYSYSDDETKEALLEIFNKYCYIADPHGAVGYLGAKKYLKSNENDHVVFLETAHPTKFLDVVKEVIKEQIPLPPQIKAIMDNEKKAISISNYGEFKRFLLA
ncbi:threonine synthase [Winogradskyella sp. KYW1333]|jgi:threonine synthase|uniref:threonine synthase n=1 Tax=Winogradskyella sp. KYW1333 TaxID=2282123 RepID=UPI000DF22AF5|nr:MULTISPECIES: threonine synthase [unclassified Winogradskyella]MDB4752392.1 threonine synthase [Winogradskyella sp.]RCT54333.1 threonine synthase [Winogradskyella sp. KYW1333]